MGISFFYLPSLFQERNYGEKQGLGVCVLLRKVALILLTISFM